jgi:hypothetical protein
LHCGAATVVAVAAFVETFSCAAAVVANKVAKAANIITFFMM